MNIQSFAAMGLRTILTLFLVTSLIGCSSAQAQDKAPTPINKQSPSAEWDPESQYYKAMVVNVRQLDSTTSNEGLLRVISSLERISRVEKDKALPRYYMAFALATLAFQEKDVDEIDVLCDRSEHALNEAQATTGVSEADILAVRAFVQYARLQVDFMGRGMEASSKAERFLLDGYELDKGNPRVLSMLALHYLRIPAQVGGSREKFCKLATLAAAAYEAEKAGRPSDVYAIVPHWGEDNLLGSQTRFCRSKAATAKTQ